MLEYLAMNEREGWPHDIKHGDKEPKKGFVSRARGYLADRYSDLAHKHDGNGLVGDYSHELIMDLNQAIEDLIRGK